MIEGITRGKIVKREDWYSVRVGKFYLLSKRINTITLSAGDTLWRIATHWVVGESQAQPVSTVEL